jgi:ubiquinone/menaquinone biosynthesis C-methylase UbiE
MAKQREKKGDSPRLSVFDLQAELGMTKHMGGHQATEELVELCYIDETTSVLDVGCGVGLTARYLATEVGCNVVGVDISSRMIVRAEEYAAKAGVSDRVRFRTADIEDLPFEDDRFDAVLIESVVSLLEKKDQAIAECVRVARPGGYVGFNEVVLIKTPPKDYLEGLSDRSGLQLGMTTPEVWKKLLLDAGLKDLVIRIYTPDIRGELRNTIRRIGFRDLLRVWGRALRLYRRDPAYRDFVRDALSEPREMLEYMGRGMFVGKKSQPLVI